MSVSLIPSLVQSETEAYISLFGRCFTGDAKFSSEYLDWQYRQNPDGEVIGTDAMDGDRLAAHYSVIPRRFVYAGEEIAGAISVNTATDPAYQRRGLFIRLAEATYEAAADRGVRFVIGVANTNSVAGFARKLGFTVLGNVRLGIARQPVAVSTGSLTTLRSATWWDWRLRNPSRRYHLAGDALQTQVRGVPFNVATIQPSVSMPLLVPRRVLRRPLALTPIFPWTERGPAVPMRFQPSPWHVIIRALDNTPVEAYARNLVLWGIDIDTF